MPTNSHLIALAFPRHWSIEPSQDQGPLLPLVPYKAILCYIYSWSHGFLHVYSLVGGLVLGRGSCLVDIVVLPMRLQTPSAFSVLSLSPTLREVPTLSPMVGCEQSHLYWSSSGRASQVTAISGSLFIFLFMSTVLLSPDISEEGIRSCYRWL